MKSQPRGSDVIAPHLHQMSNQELEFISNRMFWNILGLMKVLIKEYSKSVFKKIPLEIFKKNCQYSKNLWVNNVQNLLALVCWAETRSPATPRYLNVISEYACVVSTKTHWRHVPLGSDPMIASRIGPKSPRSFEKNRGTVAPSNGSTRLSNA